MREKRQRKKGKAIWIAAFIVLIAAAAGAFAFLLYGYDGMGLEGGSSANKSGTETSQGEESPQGRYKYNEADDQPMYYYKWRRPAEKGWIDDENGQHLYYCEGEGKLAKGWKYIEKKVWYFYQKEDVRGENTGSSGTPQEDIQVGQLARDYEFSGRIYIPQEGFFDGDEGLTMAYGIDVLDRYGWDLESAYRYSAGLRFQEEDQLNSETKIHEAALMGFETGKGNCMVWSGTFCTLARLLGKDCDLVWGTLNWNGVRPHAWAEITEGDGKDPHVYDPRKNDGQDMAGFDVHYGDGGTYDYNLDSRIYLEW